MFPVCKQCQSIVLQLAFRLKNDLHKPLTAVRVMRSECVKSNPALYNDWLPVLRQELGERNELGLWLMIMNGQLILSWFRTCLDFCNNFRYFGPYYKGWKSRGQCWPSWCSEIPSSSSTRKPDSGNGHWRFGKWIDGYSLIAVANFYLFKF